MDLRLLFPAIGLWIGVAATFFFTGQDPDPVVRNASSKLVFTLLVLGIAFFVAWLLVIWRMRPVELQSNVLRVRGIFTVFVLLGCVVSALQISAQSSDPLASWINEKPVAQISGVISTEVQTRATSTAAVWKAPEMRVVSLASEEITVGEATYSIELPFTVEVDAGVVIPPPGTSVVITGKLGQSYRYGNFAAGVSSVELIEVVGEPGFVDALAHTMRGGLSTALAGIDDRGGPTRCGPGNWRRVRAPTGAERPNATQRLGALNCSIGRKRCDCVGHGDSGQHAARYPASRSGCPFLRSLGLLRDPGSAPAKCRAGGNHGCNRL